MLTSYFILSDRVSNEWSFVIRHLSFVIGKKVVREILPTPVRAG
ncbi:hypothetical protein [Chroococcidiopsis sp. SAG 2025]|nr:hypothetical protein [Chroococcidiopsis sp. SAG 2025]